MGQSQSGEGAAQSQFDSIPSDERHGWKVMQVMANSPASGLGIVPFFSLITHIDNQRLGREEADLIPLIAEGRPAVLRILNLANLQVFEVTVTPRRGWGGDGLLGLMIRHDWFENAHLEAIHVLEVHHGSPAEQGGLRAHSDFMLGTSRLAFKGYDSLDLFLRQHDGKEGRILVFNRDSFSVREVVIRPTQQWGGAGSLGCDVGFGFLHQLPIDGKQDVRYASDADMQSQQTQPLAPPQQSQPQPLPPPQQQQLQSPPQPFQPLQQFQPPPQQPQQFHAPQPLQPPSPQQPQLPPQPVVSAPETVVVPPPEQQPLQPLQPQQPQQFQQPSPVQYQQPPPPQPQAWTPPQPQQQQQQQQQSSFGYPAYPAQPTFAPVSATAFPAAFPQQQFQPQPPVAAAAPEAPQPQTQTQVQQPPAWTPEQLAQFQQYQQYQQQLLQQQSAAAAAAAPTTSLP